MPLLLCVRFYSKIVENDCLKVLFSSLVNQAEETGLLDLTAAAIDSSKVEAYEKAVPNKKIADYVYDTQKQRSLKKCFDRDFETCPSLTIRSDNGCQMTGRRFLKALKTLGVTHERTG